LPSHFRQVKPLPIRPARLHQVCGNVIISFLTEHL